MSAIDTLRIMIIYGIFLLSAMPLTAETGAVMSYDDLQLKEGKIVPNFAVEPFCSVKCGEDKNIWDKAQTRNYENLVSINFDASKQGKKCLLVIPGPERKPGKDTAWTVLSRQIPYNGPSGAYVVDLFFSSNLDVNASDTYKTSYNSAIHWFDKNGKALSSMKLLHGGVSSGYSSVRTEGKIPIGAKMFSIQLGFDKPDVGANRYFAVSEVRLSKLPDTVNAKTFYSVKFSDAQNVWDKSLTRNYENLLSIQFNAIKQNSASLLVTRNGIADKDTAWAVKSKKIPYNGPSGEYAVDIVCASDLDAYAVSSYKSSYDSAIHWFDKSGKNLDSMKLLLGSVSDDFTTVRTEGKIPVGAKMFSIQLGFDKPDIPPGHFFAVSEIHLSNTIPAKPKFVRRYSLDTEPMFTGNGKFSWIAHCPAGTKIKFQTASVKLVEGRPSAEISAFTGPDGTSESFYEKPFKLNDHCICLRIVFETAGTKCPELISVNAGGKTLDRWFVHTDSFAPVVENLTVSPTLNRKTSIVLRISDRSQIDWQSFKAAIDGKDATARFVRQGNILTCLSEGEYSDGVHKIQLSIADIHGNSASHTKVFLIGEDTKVDKITLRDDGMTLINGKPFFPIGLYDVRKREFNNFDYDKAFTDLKEAGFNFAQSYTRREKHTEFLDMAHKHGFKVFSAARDPMSNIFVTKLRHHPAVLAWYIGDDTATFRTPTELQDLHDAVRAVDSNRITTQADTMELDSCYSRYAEYVRGTESFLPEIYPVRQDTAEDRLYSVPKVIRDMKMCFSNIRESGVREPRCIWALVQYFQGWTLWTRFPERDEIRAMSYAAIIHGATGIVWYTYGGYYQEKYHRTDYGITSTPERWKTITSITQELRDRSPVLVERTPAEQITPEIIEGDKTDVYGHPAVSCLLKKYDGKTYLLMVNSVRKPVKVRFGLKGVRNSGQVMFENRMVQRGKDGSFTDDFAPYAVHVLEFENN